MIGRLRDELAAVIAGPGLNVQARFSGQVAPPAAVITRGQVNHGEAFEGAQTVQLKVTLFVQLGASEASIERLDGLAEQVVARIDADGRFEVTDIEAEGLVSVANVELVSLPINVVAVL